MGWLGENNIGDEVLFDLFIHMFQKYNHNSNNVKIDAFSFKEEIQQKVTDYDLVVLGGGSLLHLPYWLNECLKAIKANIPIVCWGTGVDGYYKKEHLDTIRLPENVLKQYRAVFEHFKYFNVRGPFTVNSIRNCGIDVNIEEIGDPALIYAMENFDKELFNESKDETILINWGTSYNQIFGFNELRVENELVDIAKKLISAGYTITIYPVWTEDIRTVKRLVEKINHPNCQSINEVYDTNDLLKLIAKSKLTINMKLHANILSASANVPFISLAYRGKCFDFASTVNCLEYTVSTDIVTSNTVETLIEHINNNYDDVIQRFENAKNHYYPKVIESIKEISSILSP